jgi:hypothetical protein
MIETHKEEEIEFKTFNRDIIKAAVVIVGSAIIICAFFLSLKMGFDSNYVAPTTDTLALEVEYPCDTVHIIRATTYQPTVAQCDSNPFSTADGSIIDPSNMQRWCALSRDLLTRWGGEFHYGDTIDVYSVKHPQIDGEWVIHDCMNSRYKMSIDFLGNITPKLGVGTDIKIITCYEN